MTTEKQELAAGRELDALVAEKVMGIQIFNGADPRLPPVWEVIVRAYENEPVRLFAFFAKKIGKNRLGVVVGPAPNAVHICFPSGSVFNYNADTYKSLRDAYEANDETALLWLWRNRAQPFAADVLDLVVDHSRSTPKEVAGSVA
jgi:hypothetical protein